MSVLILGGMGMLGHKIAQRIPGALVTTRESWPEPFEAGRVLTRVDAADWLSLAQLLRERRPRVIVNCVGVIKQRAEAKSPIPSITLNALLPHRLAELCASWGGRLIHFSTDCVFSGERGRYSESDESDAHDLYGRTKYLGEVSVAPNALTLRTSIIGRELTHFQSLLEWLLSQNNKKIKGYTRALYSGVTTNYLAGLVSDLILEFPDLCGLHQVTAQTISKFDLLCLLRDAYNLDMEITADDSFFCDRSMIGKKFEQATGYVTPSWPVLVAQLAQDPTPYSEWRKNVRQTV
jgi:dTDP-4-dehydrorhamnose reductase